MASSLKGLPAACTSLQALGSLGVPALLALAGCAQMPFGPTVPVAPAPYKPFDVFEAEDRHCRDRAASSIASASPQGSTPTAAQPVSAGDAQYRYDLVYQQCMYDNGNLLPGLYGSGQQAPVPPLPPAGVQPAPRVR